MGLYTSKGHVLGERQRFYRMAESTVGTFVKPTTAGSMRVLSSNFKTDVPRNDRIDAYMASRDVIERITQQADYSWDMECYMTPSGSLTTPTPPSIDPFLIAAMGTHTDTPATSVVYSLNSSQLLGGLSLTRSFQELIQEAMWGCIVDQFQINVAGGKEPRIKFSGPAMGYALTGKSTLREAEASGQVVLSTTDTTVHNIMVGSVIQIDDGTNPDTNLQVTAVSTSTNSTITVTPALSNNQDNAAVISPYVPTFTEASTGLPTCALAGSITYDSLALEGISSFTLDFKNNYKKIESAFAAANMVDAIGGIRNITGKIQTRLREDNITKFAYRNKFTNVAVTVVIGTVGTGNAWTISMPYCELDYLGQIGYTEQGETPVEFSYTCLANSSLNNSLTITMS